MLPLPKNKLETKRKLTFKPVDCGAKEERNFRTPDILQTKREQAKVMSTKRKNRFAKRKGEEEVTSSSSPK